MPSGNGARAQQKRERNAAKQASTNKAHSQLKANEKSLTLKCALCLVRDILDFMRSQKRQTYIQP
jgi:hypothetical protein